MLSPQLPLIIFNCENTISTAQLDTCVNTTSLSAFANAKTVGTVERTCALAGCVCYSPFTIHHSPYDLLTQWKIYGNFNTRSYGAQLVAQFGKLGAHWTRPYPQTTNRTADRPLADTHTKKHCTVSFVGSLKFCFFHCSLPPRLWPPAPSSSQRNINRPASTIQRLL